MQIKLTLDIRVDANLINELQNRSNGGAMSKVLYLVIYEWYFAKYALDPSQGQSGTDQGQSGTDQGQLETDDDLTKAIEDEW